jgi:hypothetical protein
LLVLVELVAVSGPAFGQPYKPIGPSVWAADIWCERLEAPTLAVAQCRWVMPGEVSMHATEAFEGIRVFGEHARQRESPPVS